MSGVWWQMLHMYIYLAEHTHTHIHYPVMSLYDYSTVVTVQYINVHLLFNDSLEKNIPALISKR